MDDSFSDGPSILGRRFLLGDDNKDQSRAVQDANSILLKAQAATRPSCCGLWGKVDHELAGELFLEAGSSFASVFEADAAAEAFQSSVDSFLIAGVCRRALTALQHKAKVLSQLSPLAAVGALRQITDLCLDTLRDHSGAARASHRISLIYEEQFMQSWQEQERAVRLGMEDDSQLDLASLHLAIDACQLAARCYDQDPQLRPHWVRTVGRLGNLHMWAESYGQAIVALNKAIGEKVCEELACWSTPELMFNAGLSWIALDCLVRFGGPAVVTGGFTTLEEDEKTGGDGSEAVHAPQAPPEGSADLSHSTQAIEAFIGRFPTFAQERCFVTLARIRNILLDTAAPISAAAENGQPVSPKPQPAGNRFNSHSLHTTATKERDNPQVSHLLGLMDDLHDSCGLKPEQEKVFRHIVQLVSASS